MQIGLHTTSPGTSTLTSPLIKPPGIEQHPSAVKIRATAAHQGARFPDPPLISIQPPRYNVQLNHQLTALQYADSYLVRVESRLLQLRYAVKQERDDTEVKQYAQRLLTLLQQRPAASGGHP